LTSLSGIEGTNLVGVANGDVTPEIDVDGDGFPLPEDCNDADPDVHPGASERCNGEDDDCDGVVPADEADADLDGFRICNGDCDDNEANNYPGNAEVCDGQDNDCDTDIDEGFDADSDGIADCFDDCPFDADNDIDGDGVCGDVDNCPDDPNPDQTDFNGDGVGDACTACEPDPRTQGYWHRQCLGVSTAEGGIDPGRNGRGPQEPLEADFDKSMDAAGLRLEAFFEFGGACAGGMDAVPASDQCERALKQTTALLFNLASSKLSGSCPVDLLPQGCSSTNLTDLVGELEGLFNSGDPDNCQTAAACAAAVNEGTALESAAVMAVEMSQSLDTDTATTSTATFSGTTDSVVMPEEVEPAEPAGPAEAPRPPAQFLMVTPQVPEAEAPAAGPPEDTVVTLERHLAVVSNRSAPERAVKVSTDALLTALSGGYDPEMRLEIVKGLLGRLDVAYHDLVVGHLEEIRAEAEDFDKKDLVREATRLLRQLEPALE
jgi:hypothetical protein